MKNKVTVRKLKVHSRYKARTREYVSVPEIMLQGKWLEDVGFTTDTYIDVACEDGKIVITPREPEVVAEVIKTINEKGSVRIAETSYIYK